MLLYGDVDGMWLQTGTEATARVRILGPHRMVSSDVNYEFSQLVASEASKQDEQGGATPVDARVVNQPAFRF